MGICSSCEQEKDLTVHGTCWKCHVGGIQSKGGCRNCGKNPDEFRIRKDIKAKTTVTSIREV